MKPSNGLNKKYLSSYLKHGSALIAVLVILFPLYMIFINAFKGNEEYITSGLFDMPNSFLYWKNFKVVLQIGRMGQAFINTLILISMSLTFYLILGTMLSYALGRFEFKMKKLILGLYAMAVLIPSITTQVATFSIIKNLGLFNTFYAPSLLYIGSDIVQIYLYLQFIKNIPYELDESAMIEGASLFTIYRKIVLPLLAPATATIAILKTLGIYNDIYTPYLYMPSPKLGVISTTLLRFKGTHSAQWNMICAGILIVLLPTVILYLFLQKYIFAGIASGAVK
ncbi:carbohydrate ABC transporter permease [Paenibacillus psychroresistens]|uniref:Carbohydrate ABC transporter permease n=1 Tax=Paenibacillus psychroresistens TaxID=1778678 RepID=A0A6B8RGY6_9BACL|nr:carbohydrate ABC transporter permease [Paenibacillus psychroresistens]QGQ94793.1 carbohydrate ABC transporter permease [Paenibacillus psychroresistens]